MNFKIIFARKFTFIAFLYKKVITPRKQPTNLDLQEDKFAYRPILWGSRQMLWYLYVNYSMV
jgi:hypothetical protein